jgi:REP element-mobilizing transposase RayT
MDDQDRARFIHNLFEFNDTAPAQEHERVVRVRVRDNNVGRATSHIRDRIVDVHGWKLMKNHVHLILSERMENGLSLFLRKMSGYGRYFNERHGRRGTLFERTKKVRIEQRAHFLYILHYIHLNGLDDFPGAQSWRERDAGMIVDRDAAFAHLLADKWSSLRDYCGEKNFPSILTKKLFEAHPGEYELELRSFMKECSSGDLDSRMLE